MQLDTHFFTKKKMQTSWFLNQIIILVVWLMTSMAKWGNIYTLVFNHMSSSLKPKLVICSMVYLGKSQLGNCPSYGLSAFWVLWWLLYTHICDLNNSTAHLIIKLAGVWKETDLFRLLSLIQHDFQRRQVKNLKRPHYWYVHYYYLSNWAFFN